MKHLYDIPFAYRVLLGCLVVALVPMLISNLLMLRLFSSTLQSQAAATATRQIHEMEQRLDEIFRTCSDISSRIAGTDTVTHALIDSTYGLQADVNLALYRASDGLRTGATLSLYDVGGRLRFTTDNSTAYATLPVRWGALRKAEGTKHIVYYNIEKFSGLVSPYAIHTAQSLYTKEGIMVGYTVISLSTNTFQSSLAGLFSDQGSVLVLDPVGGLVYSSRSTVPEAELQVLHRQLLSTGEPVLEQDNYQYYISQNTRSGFYIILRQPKPFTGDALKTMQDVAKLTSLLSLVLCILFSFFISRGLSRPVSRLSRAMDRIKQGQLDIRVETKHMDQLGRLAMDFNQMAEELQLYLDKIVRQQREMDESQIRLLQAQLNPHFLYNTLDTVKWLAKINNIPDIASISSNLAIILRQCVSSEDFVTLRQELDMVESYVDIQRIRFSGRFQYVVNLPDTLADCMIPKLILQPIVENAIIHGLADKENGYVYIYAVTDGTDLLISVTDDGCGMPPEAVERLRRSDSKILDGHLGLYNVSHIIKINYGKEYGLRANAIAGIGTTVMVKLPLQREVHLYDEGYRG